MMITYLITIWILLTALVSGSRTLRRNTAALLLWFVLTAVVLWPVVRRVYASPLAQAYAQELHREFVTEFEQEFKTEFKTEFEEVTWN